MNDKDTAEALPALLIVNDEPNSLIALTAALEGGPWRMVATGSGLGAFKQLLIDDFAVIMLDVRMPGLNGFEVAEMIRARPRCATTPIIFCTASARTPDDVFKGYELGAVDYLLTPVSPRLLRSKIAVFVELYQQRRRLARSVAELQQARETLEWQNRELTRSAMRDAFTGCLNRYGFELATSSLFDATHHGGELSMVAVELDRPGASDPMHLGAQSHADVRRLARLLGGALREDDELCRWSDEQFVIALGHTALDQAAQIVKRLRERIRNEPIAGLRDAQTPRLTASIGLASTALGAATLEALVAQAGVALRSARQAGGGTVRRYDQLPGSAAPG